MFMAQPQPGGMKFDMSRLTSADKLILGGSAAYFIWSFLPFWYTFSIPGCSGNSLGIACSASINGWHGITVFPVILSLVGLAWTGARVAGMTSNMRVNFPLAYIDLGLAGLTLLFTLLGLVVKPAGAFKFSWGLFVAIILAGVWAYGAYMRYQEPAAVGPPPGAGPPPPPASGGGFSA
jgi:hypothetical protein